MWGQAEFDLQEPATIVITSGSHRDGAFNWRFFQNIRLCVAFLKQEIVRNHLINKPWVSNELSLTIDVRVKVLKTQMGPHTSIYLGFGQFSENPAV